MARGNARLIGLGAPLQRELRGYLKRTINQRQLIAEMEDAGFEIGDRDQWPSVLRNFGYRHGLVDKNGNIESPAAERLLRKFRSAFLEGVKQNEDLKKGAMGAPIAKGDATEHPSGQPNLFDDAKAANPAGPKL